MLNVFFRYIFGIPSLMLVLLPSTSPACERRNMTVILENYKNIIQREIDHLEISSLCQIECALQKQAKAIHRNFRCLVYRMSQSLSATLECRCRNAHQKREKAVETKERKKTSKQTEECKTISQPSGEKKCTRALCKLMKTISSFRSCWNKLAYLSSNRTLLENIC
ncbi:interleukin-7 isoform X3 [Microcaecilia unicolor]|uniref:Interleukin-7 n=1 Tax=Microcaecilia unicolor TaxID=1415580 RepID=A0A6P7Z7E2_9AMPH|nr:interleukin-7 isoform X3 [Microcaecilia unicolor]